MMSDFNSHTSKASKPKRKKITKRDVGKKVFVGVSILAFLGISGSALVGSLADAFRPLEPTVEAVPSAAEQANALVEREQGFELVLEREPNNQVALEGLINTRLEMGHVEDAIPPLETLVSLNEDREDLQTLLTQLKTETPSP